MGAGEEHGAAAASAVAAAEMEEANSGLDAVRSQHSAAPRVRVAMKAAMDYRVKKAQATKAAADAAAAAAKAGWHDTQLTAAKAAAAADVQARRNDATRPASRLDVQQDGGLVPGSTAAPADEVVRAQAVAHRALEEVRHAEAEVRRALRLDLELNSESEDEGAGPLEGTAARVAGAGA